MCSNHVYNLINFSVKIYTGEIQKFLDKIDFRNIMWNKQCLWKLFSIKSSKKSSAQILKDIGESSSEQHLVFVFSLATTERQVQSLLLAVSPWRNRHLRRGNDQTRKCFYKCRQSPLKGMFRAMRCLNPPSVRISHWKESFRTTVLNTFLCWPRIPHSLNSFQAKPIFEKIIWYRTQSYSYSWYCCMQIWNM